MSLVVPHLHTDQLARLSDVLVSTGDLHTILLYSKCFDKITDNLAMNKLEHPLR